jgi:cytochrome c oxidase subunit 3
MDVRTRNSRGGLAIRFFLAAVALLVMAFTAAMLLPRWPQLVGNPPGTIFPPVFALSTACLLFVSGALSRAEVHVVRERQAMFRGSLRQSLAAGTAFLAVQSYALAAFFSQQSGTQAGRGATEFVAVAVALHGMHVLIAWLFLLYIVLQAQADRYDHEYYAGVTFCAWFWHVLGIIWVVVLCVMAIANQGIIDDGITPEVRVNRNIPRQFCSATDSHGTMHDSRALLLPGFHGECSCLPIAHP